MKKLLAAVIALMFIISAGLVWAEGMKCEGPGMNGKEQGNRLERLTQELKLTDDQKSKVAAILKEDEPAMKALQDKMMSDMKALRAASDTKIEGILTPDQIKKYEQMQQEHQKKMGEGKGMGRMGMKGRKGMGAEGKGKCEECPCQGKMPMSK
jgi:periplasmic protein CpxP/Spy